MKKNESSGERLDFLRCSVKGRSAGGNLLAKMLPTFEKCLFKIFGIHEESLVKLLLLSGYFNLPTDSPFLWQRFNNSFMPCHVFFFFFLKIIIKKGAVTVFLSQTYNTANFISIIFILFLIANLVQSVFFL